MTPEQSEWWRQSFPSDTSVKVERPIVRRTVSKDSNKPVLPPAKDSSQTVVQEEKVVPKEAREAIVKKEIKNTEKAKIKTASEKEKPTATTFSPPGVRLHRVWLWQEDGDCLWNLAKHYYGDPRKWPKIYQANRDRIRNPRVIFPKQELIIPPDIE